MKRRTKIVATLGPSSWDLDIIRQLIEAGVNVFRLNFSHGTHQEFTKVIERVRSISSDLYVPICLLQDLQGPKIRIGEIQGEQVFIEPGQKLKLTVNPRIGNQEIIYVAFDDLPRYVQSDDRILLDDGRIELKVIGKTDEDIQTQVIVGGKLKSHKGVNLPGVEFGLVSLTEKDLADLAFGLNNQVDMIALSFVHSPKDLTNLKQEIIRLEPESRDIPIIAKLERPEALEKLDAIIEVADGVMVARGDLGIEMSPEAVPIAQKKIITAANRHAKIVITATQMLESMIHNPRPTRAETTDIANAIFDGTDAVMLSGETAIGDFPVRSVETMHKIISQAEDNLSDWGHWEGDLGEEASSVVTLGDVTHDDALSITRAAKELAHDRNVTAIAVFTQSGRTASLMAKARPRVPILAFTPNKDTYKRMALFWGVIPHMVPYSDTVEAMLEKVEETILDTTTLNPGQQIVLISGFPVGAMCPPNLALLHTIRGRNYTPSSS